MSSFRFKQFLVEQNNSAMRVNTDGVLLGAWMSLPQAEVYSLDCDIKESVEHLFRFLDIGTGTGVIALMAAQRASKWLAHAKREEPSFTGYEQSSLEIDALGIDALEIDALEIEEGAFNDAKANFANSPWGDASNNLSSKNNIKLSAYLTSLQEFNPISKVGVDNRYDLIFSNPPYFIESLKSNSSAKCSARHTDTLSQGDLIKHALRLIKPKGIFALVLPVVEGEAFISKINFIRDIALKSREEKLFFSIKRICYIKTTEKKAPKRVLLELVASTNTGLSLNGEQAISERGLDNGHFFAQSGVALEEIIISSGGDYTEQYRILTQNFYLNF